MVGYFSKTPELSPGTKELLVKVWPWLALIGGLFQLFAAWSLYVWARSTNELINLADRINSNNELGVELEVGRWDAWVIIAFITLIVDAIILLVAFPKLQAQQKIGWNLMLISGLISLFYSFGAILLSYRGSIVEDIWSIFVAIVVLYLLFQVRNYYIKKAK